MSTRSPSRFPQYACTAAFGVVAVLAVIGGWGMSGIAREIWWLRVTGYAAFTFLAFALLATPTKLALNRFRPGSAKPAAVIRWRRSLGITSGLLALSHGGVAFTTYLGWSWQSVIGIPYVRAGFVAASILAALLVTSFPAIVKHCHVRFWIHLHRLAYVAVFFVFQHALLAPFSDRFWIAILFGTLASLSLLRLLSLWPAAKNSPSNLPRGTPTLPAS